MLCCTGVTDSQDVKSRHGTDHIDFCLTGCGWVNACTDLSGYWAMCGTMYLVWLCVYVWGPRRGGVTELTCVRQRCSLLGLPLTLHWPGSPELHALCSRPETPPCMIMCMHVPAVCCVCAVCDNGMQGLAGMAAHHNNVGLCINSQREPHNSITRIMLTYILFNIH